MAKYVFKQKYQTCLVVVGREAGMRWEYVFRGVLGSVLPVCPFAGRHGLHGVGVITRHPSCKNLPLCNLPGFSALDTLASGTGKKGGTALTSWMPPTTAFPSKIFPPSRTRKGVVGMKAVRVGWHLFPIHQGLSLFMSTIRQSVIKG